MNHITNEYFKEENNGNEEHGAGTSWLELEAADQLVSDEKLEERYGGTTFVEEDFA